MRQHYPNTKTRQQYSKNRKLETNISHEDRNDNPEQNISTLNPALCKKEWYTINKWKLFQVCKAGLIIKN